MFSFDHPEDMRKPKVFWCFQGNQKGTLGESRNPFSAVVLVLLLYLALTERFCKSVIGLGFAPSLKKGCFGYFPVF